MAKLKLHISEDGLRREVKSGGELPDLFFQARPRGGAITAAVEAGDFALIAMLPIAMQAQKDLHAEFEVDSVLLDGLDHFQEVWCDWRPDIFRKKIKITTAGEVVRQPTIQRTQDAVVAFSSGLDSTFTLSRHACKDAGRATRNVRTAVMVHGFDMPLDAEEGFETLARNGSAICDELGIQLVTVSTNWRRLVSKWEMTFGVGLASVLHQFSGDHGIALVATEESYQNSFPVWGNSFWSDRFFSSSSMKLESDGGAYDRIERARYVGRHSKLVPHLRVCWAGPRTGENCGVCPKCILTKLNFVAAGVAQPWPFSDGLTEESIANMALKTHWQREFLKIILSKIEKDPAVKASIVSAVAARLDRDARVDQPRKIFVSGLKSVLKSPLAFVNARARNSRSRRAKLGSPPETAN